MWHRLQGLLCGDGDGVVDVEDGVVEEEEERGASMGGLEESGWGSSIFGVVCD